MTRLKRRITAIVGFGLGNFLAINGALMLFFFWGYIPQLPVKQAALGVSFLGLLTLAGLAIVYLTSLILRECPCSD